jgi:hypothetical protein
MRRLLGIAGDALVVILAIASLAIYAKKQGWFQTAPHTSEPFFQIGRSLPVTGLQYSDANANVVLALSSDCQFCSASAPFYRRLLTLTSGRNDLKFTAIFRQPASEASNYLTSMKVPTDRINVLGSSLSFPGKAVGTPTLLVVGNDGIVRKAWVGKLSHNQELEVLATLSIPTNDGGPSE